MKRAIERPVTLPSFQAVRPSGGRRPGPGPAGHGRRDRGRSEMQGSDRSGEHGETGSVLVELMNHLAQSSAAKTTMPTG